MKTEKYLYWTYFLPESYKNPSIIPGFFDFLDYKENFLFLHVKTGISFNLEKDRLLSEISEYTFEVSKEEEDYILSNMGERGKKGYIDKIKDFGLGEDYLLYAVSITEKTVELFNCLLNTLKTND